MNDNKKWYRSLRRSTLTPPDYVFGIVWTILYITMFISFILVATHKQCKYTCFPLIIFLVGFFFNIIWSYLFFTLQQPALALIDLIIMYIINIITLIYFYKINSLATYILIPYTLWISFALYLNLYIVSNN